MAPSFTSFAILFTWMGYLLIVITIILSNKRVQINLPLYIYISINHTCFNHSTLCYKKHIHSNPKVMAAFGCRLSVKVKSMLNGPVWATWHQTIVSQRGKKNNNKKNIAVCFVAWASQQTLKQKLCQAVTRVHKCGAGWIGHRGTDLFFCFSVKLPPNETSISTLILQWLNTSIPAFNIWSQTSGNFIGAYL